MKRNFKVLINNSTNISKTHNHLSPQIRVIKKSPNTEQSSKGKSKTHKSTNRQNQSTTGKLGKPQLIGHKKTIRASVAQLVSKSARAWSILFILGIISGVNNGRAMFNLRTSVKMSRWRKYDILTYVIIFSGPSFPPKNMIYSSPFISFS